MSLDIIVNGKNFTGFLNAKVTINFLEATGKAYFTATAKNTQGGIYPLRAGDKVQITVNQVPVITGFIDKLSNYVDASTQTIDLAIRDSTGDLIDSTLDSDNTKEINPPISLADICKIILKSLNINIDVIDKTDGKKFKTGDIVTPQLKDTGFGFLEKYAQKKQVIIRASGDGNLLLERGSSEKYLSILSVSKDSLFNNIISRQLSIDFTKRYHKYILESQGSAAISDLSFLDDQNNKQTVLNAVTSVKATALDNEIRNSRQYAFSPAATYINETAKNRAIWEVNIRRAQSIVYTCTVQGFTPASDNDIWDVNRLIIVDDKFADIAQEMLIDSVTYKVDLNSGETCDLKLVSKDAYQLQAQKDLRTSSTDQNATDFSFLDNS